MATKQLDWATIDREAEALGVIEATRRKWRQRRVPYEWRLQIMERLASQGLSIRASDFDDLNGAAA